MSKFIRLYNSVNSINNAISSPDGDKLMFFNYSDSVFYDILYSSSPEILNSQYQFIIIQSADSANIPVIWKSNITGIDANNFNIDIAYDYVNNKLCVIDQNEIVISSDLNINMQIPLSELNITLDFESPSRNVYLSLDNDGILNLNITQYNIPLDDGIPVGNLQSYLTPIGINVANGYSNAYKTFQSINTNGSSISLNIADYENISSIYNYLISSTGVLDSIDISKINTYLNTVGIIDIINQFNNINVIDITNNYNSIVNKNVITDSDFIIETYPSIDSLLFKDFINGLYIFIKTWNDTYNQINQNLNENTITFANYLTIRDFLSNYYFVDDYFLNNYEYISLADSYNNYEGAIFELNIPNRFNSNVFSILDINIISKINTNYITPLKNIIKDVNDQINNILNNTLTSYNNDNTCIGKQPIPMSVYNFTDKVLSINNNNQTIQTGLSSINIIPNNGDNNYLYSSGNQITTLVNTTDTAQLNINFIDFSTIIGNIVNIINNADYSGNYNFILYLYYSLNTNVVTISATTYIPDQINNNSINYYLEYNNLLNPPHVYSNNYFNSVIKNTYNKILSANIDYFKNNYYSYLSIVSTYITSNQPIEQRDLEYVNLNNDGSIASYDERYVSNIISMDNYIGIYNNNIANIDYLYKLYQTNANYQQIPVTIGTIIPNIENLIDVLNKNIHILIHLLTDVYNFKYYLNDFVQMKTGIYNTYITDIAYINDFNVNINNSNNYFTFKNILNRYSKYINDFRTSQNTYDLDRTELFITDDQGNKSFPLFNDFRLYYIIITGSNSYFNDGEQLFNISTVNNTFILSTIGSNDIFNITSTLVNPLIGVFNNFANNGIFINFIDNNIQNILNDQINGVNIEQLLNDDTSIYRIAISELNTKISELCNYFFNDIVNNYSDNVSNLSDSIKNLQITDGINNNLTTIKSFNFSQGINRLYNYSLVKQNIVYSLIHFTLFKYLQELRDYLVSFEQLFNDLNIYGGDTPDPPYTSFNSNINGILEQIKSEVSNNDYTVDKDLISFISQKSIIQSILTGTKLAFSEQTDIAKYKLYCNNDLLNLNTESLKIINKDISKPIKYIIQNEILILNNLNVDVSNNPSYSSSILLQKYSFKAMLKRINIAPLKNCNSEIYNNNGNNQNIQNIINNSISILNTVLTDSQFNLNNFIIQNNVILNGGIINFDIKSTSLSSILDAQNMIFKLYLNLINNKDYNK